MSNSDQILALLSARGVPMTAMEILAELFPQKTQPYINGTIKTLVGKGMLIRHYTRPYTVEINSDNSTAPSPNTTRKDISNSDQILELLSARGVPMTAMEILAELFPQKTQPYINGTIKTLVGKGMLIRNYTRPYTVEINSDNCTESSLNTTRKATERPIKRHKATPPPTVPRGDTLKNNFNAFWNDFFNTDIDYYASIPYEKLVDLKMKLSEINNLITYETTIMAAQRIFEILSVPEAEQATILNLIESTSSNANGYDIEHYGTRSFICEVKGNIPAGGKSRFGAAQRKQIIKNVDGLLNGKTKSSITTNDIDSYYKFMCFYSNKGTTDHAIHNFINRFGSRYDNKLILYSGQKELRYDAIYILLLAKA